MTTPASLPRPPAKPCTYPLCQRQAMRGYRYCQSCFSFVKNQMERDKYLREVPGTIKPGDLM